MTWIAVLDILIVAFVIYQALVFIKGRAPCRWSSEWLWLCCSSISRAGPGWIRCRGCFRRCFPTSFSLSSLYFQSEIRRALAHFGETAFPARNFTHQSDGVY